MLHYRSCKSGPVVLPLNTFTRVSWRAGSEYCISHALSLDQQVEGCEQASVVQTNRHYKARTTSCVTSDVDLIIGKGLYPGIQTLQHYRKPGENTTSEITADAQKIWMDTLPSSWVRKNKAFWKHLISRKFWILAFLDIKPYYCAAHSQNQAKWLFNLSWFRCWAKVEFIKQLHFFSVVIGVTHYLSVFINVSSS